MPQTGPAAEGDMHNVPEARMAQTVLQPENVECDFLRISNYNRQD